MPPEYIQLTPGQLAIAASLILVSGLVSILLRLGLEKQLALAAVRTVVQLILLGQVLNWVFAPGRAWYVVLAIMAAMTLIAGGAAVSRVGRPYRGIWLDSVVSMWASSWRSPPWPCWPSSKSRRKPSSPGISRSMRFPCWA